MNYYEEAKNGERICVDELRVLDMMEMIRDVERNKEDPTLALMRIYYAGYSVGYKDAIGLVNAKTKADNGGDGIEVQD